MLAQVIVQLLCAVGIKCQMEGKIVYGNRVDIRSFPYSAFLFMKFTDQKQNYICGSSIMNQKILLTAAHCVENCINNICTSGVAFIGNEDLHKGVKIPLTGYIMHEHFDPNVPSNDIGLVAVHGNIEFSEFVKRVAILNKPPSFKVAAVAGWGLIDEVLNIHTHYLHSITQRIWPLEECRKVVHNAPNGTFCGGELHGHQYASEGDSGSALVAEGYIQLGLVSFSSPGYTPSIVFYTHVPFFYSWIKRNSRALYCSSKIKVKVKSRGQSPFAQKSNITPTETEYEHQ